MSGHKAKRSGSLHHSLEWGHRPFKIHHCEVSPMYARPFVYVNVLVCVYLWVNSVSIACLLFVQPCKFMEKDMNATGDCTNTRAEPSRDSRCTQTQQCLLIPFGWLHGNGSSPVTTGHYCFVLQHCNCGEKCVCVMEEECMLKPMTFGQELTEHPHDSLHVCVCVFDGWVCISNISSVNLTD